MPRPSGTGRSIWQASAPWADGPESPIQRAKPSACLGGGGFDLDTVQTPFLFDNQIHFSLGIRLPVIQTRLLTTLPAGFFPFTDHGGRGE